MNGCSVTRPTQLLLHYADTPPALDSPFGRAPDHRNRRPRPTQHNAPPAFSDDQRRPDCVLLRRSALHRRQRWGHRATADERARLYIIPALLTRWRTAGVYLAVRRQHGGLHDAGYRG